MTIVIPRKPGQATTLHGIALPASDPSVMAASYAFAQNESSWAKISKDGGALTLLETAPVEEPVNSGLYKITLSAAEMAFTKMASIVLYDDAAAFYPTTIILDALQPSAEDYTPARAAKLDVINGLTATVSEGSLPASADLEAVAYCALEKTIEIEGESSTGWDAFMFSIKADKSAETDAEALVQVVVRADPGNDGLVRLNGHDVSAFADERAKASISVDETNPANTVVTIALEGGALAIPASDSTGYDWQLVRWIGDRKTAIAGGKIVVADATIRQTQSP